MKKGITFWVMPKREFYPRERLLKKEMLFGYDPESANSTLFEARSMDEVAFLYYQWDYYAVGYYYAADLIVNNALDATLRGEDRQRINVEKYHILIDRIDIVVFPVIFLYRQYLETRLKTMIIKDNIINKLESGEAIDINLLLSKKDTNHKLDVLWKKCKEIIKKNYNEQGIDTNDEIELNVMEEYIEEYKNLDGSSYTFRYPVNTNGELHHLDIPQINIKKLSEIMKNILNYLEFYKDCQNGSIDYYMYDRIDYYMYDR